MIDWPELKFPPINLYSYPAMAAYYNYWKDYE